MRTPRVDYRGAFAGENPIDLGIKAARGAAAHRAARGAGGLGAGPQRRTRELEKQRGIVGTPLLEINTRFLRPATYGDELQIVTTIESWAAKTFTHRHRVMRGEELLCEGTEVRAFVMREPGSGRLRAVPVPEDIRALCS